MHLDRPFLQLPLLFDDAVLGAEIACLPDRAWTPHPNGIPGNEAVRLITPGGRPTDDLTGAPMRPTEFLSACPYIMQVMAAIGTVWGRARLMRLAAGATVPPHIDTHFYWRTHLRIHVPIVTNRGVSFTCDDQTIHMAGGECWVFDTFAMHHVRNAGSDSRTHLVIDTVGDEALWSLMERAKTITPAARREVPIVTPCAEKGALKFEHAETGRVMTPWELDHHVKFALGQTTDGPNYVRAAERLDTFVAEWAGLYAQFASSIEGVPHYRRAMARLDADFLMAWAGELRLRNRIFLRRQIAELIFALEATLPEPQVERAA